MDQAVRWAYNTPELGEAVRRVRREAGFTQADLAERLGVTRMTLSRLEHGEAVSVETALRALSECGYAVAIAPKFSRVLLEHSTTTGTLSLDPPMAGVASVTRRV